jgi:hypothetical protein
MIMLQKFAAILLLSFGLPALAGGFDFLPGNTGAEKEFRDLMNNGNFKQALMVWPTTHQASGFGDGPTGTAVYSYLLYQNGLPYFGLDMVTTRTQPGNIDSDMLKIWEKEFKASALIQKGFIPTRAGWRSVVNNEEVTLKIRNKKDIQAAFARAGRVAADQVNQRARILWQIATLAPLINETGATLTAIKQLQSSGQTVIGQDQIFSAKARVLYQKNDMQGALDAYAQIPKSSMLWIESVEERAWAHLRRDDFDKALGESTTLLSPALAPLVGPESYFLTNLLALKACDYPRIFKNSENFKQRHRNRLVELQALADTGSNKNLSAVLTKFEQKGVSLEAIGALVESVPRTAFRDQKFALYMESRKQILAELERAADLGSLGENTSLSKTIGSTKVKADNYRKQAVRRLRTLAAAELKEYRKIINKMHIVEAEVIQRLHVDENLKGERSKLSKNEDSADLLIFPYNSDEVWFDELDNYRARVKDCPTLKGASL